MNLFICERLYSQRSSGFRYVERYLFASAKAWQGKARQATPTSQSLDAQVTEMNKTAEIKHFYTVLCIHEKQYLN